MNAFQSKNLAMVSISRFTRGSIGLATGLGGRRQCNKFKRSVMTMQHISKKILPLIDLEKRCDSGTVTHNLLLPGRADMQHGRVFVSVTHKDAAVLQGFHIGTMIQFVEYRRQCCLW